MNELAAFGIACIVALIFTAFIAWRVYTNVSAVVYEADSLFMGLDSESRIIAGAVSSREVSRK